MEKEYVCVCVCVCVFGVVVELRASLRHDDDNTSLSEVEREETMETGHGPGGSSPPSSILMNM